MNTCNYIEQNRFNLNTSKYDFLYFPALETALGGEIRRDDLKLSRKIGIFSQKESILISAIFPVLRTVGFNVSRPVPLLKKIELHATSNRCMVIKSKNCIKLVDFEKEQILNTARSTSDNSLLENEIRTRQQASEFVSVPEIINYSIKKDSNQFSFYIEELISGDQMNNINHSEYLELIDGLMLELFDWYNHNCVQIVKYNSYIECQINNLKRLEIYKETQNHISSLFKLAKKEINPDINLVTSHGDFHSRNIIYSNGKLYLYDWELSDLRSELYDIFNLCFNSIVFENNPFFMNEYIHGKGSESLINNRYSSEEISLYFYTYMIEKFSILCTKYNNRDKAKRRIKRWSNVFKNEMDRII